MRFFASCFFHESASPQPQSIPLGSFQIFLKICGDFCKSRCTTGINDTGGKFETSGKNCCWYQKTQSANLPPVSTTPAANFATSFASVVDTGGEFATGVNDTGGK
jgi:hypothetical protein